MATNPGNKSGSGSGNSQKSEGQGSQKSEGQAGKRGFAAMDVQTQREIASKGGQAAHQKGTAHEFDSEEARRAGQKGGEAVSRDRSHMAEIGRKGGESRQAANRDHDSAAVSRSVSSEQSAKTGRQGNKNDGK